MKIIRKKLLSILVSLSIISAIIMPASTVYAAGGDTVVYVTKTGKCYHNDGCSSLSKSKIETTLEKAAKKYKPCSKCNPPTLDAQATTSKSTKAVTTSKASATASDEKDVTYIANASSKKFHKPSCASVKKMKEENKLELTCTRQEAIDQGYDACKKCKP
jgi:methylphosphotriester-DNA--protein-cysteine methyltransferase